MLTQLWAGTQLPHAGVKLSMIVFGGLSLLILGGGLFMTGRRRERGR